MTRSHPSSIWRDDGGAVAPIVAVLSTVLIALSAFVIDVGMWYVGQHKLQAATEAAALSAAAQPLLATGIDLATAKARATSYLVQNGYPNVTPVVVVGRYCPQNGLGQNSFLAAGTPCPNLSPPPTNFPNTAVRVQTSQVSQQYFSRIFGSHSPIPTLSATATSARIDEAGMAMTTGILGLDSGLVNTLLSALAGPGTNLALSSTQYQALLASNVDAALFFDALAQRVGETGTYSALVSRTVSITDILAASQTALGSNAAAIDALQALSGKLKGSISVPLTGLFDLGVWEKMPVGGSQEQPNLRAGLNAYQLIAYALESANPSGLNVTLTSTSTTLPPGIVQVQLVGTALGQVARARFAFGAPGETAVTTSALRIQLVARILNFGNLLSGVPGVSLVTGVLNPLLNVLSADVPILIDVAAGSAELFSMSCGQEAATDTQVGVTARSGLLTVYLGTLPANVLSNPFKPVTVTPVTIVNLLGIMTVDIQAVVGSVFGGEKTLNFRQVAGGHGIIGHPPTAGQFATIDNGSQLGPLLTSLKSQNKLVVNACVKVLGVCVGTPQLVTNVISAVGTPVGALADPLLNGILAALGIQPGYANVWVTGARCGVPVLV